MNGLMWLGIVAFGMTIVSTSNAAGADEEHHDQCATICFDCQQACLACADSCLAEMSEGKGDRKACIRLCLDCADICAACARIDSRGGPLRATIAAACAKACERCAAECEKHKDDKACQACAEQCRKCAKECKAMAK